MIARKGNTSIISAIPFYKVTKDEIVHKISHKHIVNLLLSVAIFSLQSLLKKPTIAIMIAMYRFNQNKPSGA